MSRPLCLAVFQFLCLLSMVLTNFATMARAERTYLAFPKGFKWCVATAAHQFEGYNTNSDWWDWEQQGGRIRNNDKSGAACDHWNRLDQDTKLIKELNLQQYRFSVEWAKIEPQEGSWDAAAIVHYQTEVALLKENGIEPLITLHHFSMPRWLRDRGGWEWEGAPAAFARFAELVYKEIGPGVRDWITVNEPMVHIAGGYFAGLTPPGKNDLMSAMPPLEGLLHAHASAYHALHSAAKSQGDLPIRVGIAHHLRVFDPDSIFNPLDAMAARTLDTAFNWLFGDAIETGRLKLFIPFILNINKEIPGLKGTQDFIGINYYTRDMVSFSLNGLLGLELVVNEQSPLSDLGWEIYPEGFYRTIKAAMHHYPGKPILITENGLADSQDQQRKKFIENHLAAVHRAILEGVPIETYCHWTLTDNFEWLEGFAPRFGLYEMDYPTQRRTLRESGRYYSEIAKGNGLWAEPFKPRKWEWPFFKDPTGGQPRKQRY
jgi:beta-glucosidase